MCTVSFIGDQWGKTWPPANPWVQPWTTPNVPFVPEPAPPTREEFEALKAELVALKSLLAAAKEYDRATGQPDCEVDEKVALIKRLAELVDVDLDDLFD